MRVDKQKNIAKVAEVIECSCRADRWVVINKTTQQHIEVIESCWKIILACNKVIEKRLESRKESMIHDSKLLHSGILEYQMLCLFDSFRFYDKR